MPALTPTRPAPATPATPAPARTHVHEVLVLLETAHGLTARYCKRDTRVITIVADAAARRFADSDPTTRVACYPDGCTVYSVDVAGGWTVRFAQFTPAQPSPPAALSLSELAAPYGDDARVVTGDDGLDHYL